jgi:hypothetical protein
MILPSSSVLRIKSAGIVVNTVSIPLKATRLRWVQHIVESIGKKHCLGGCSIATQGFSELLPGDGRQAYVDFA